MRSPQEGSAYPKCRNVCRIVFLPRHWQSCLLVKKYGLPAIWHSSSTGLFTTEYRHGDVPWQMKQCGTQKSSGVRCIFLECDDTDTARRFTKQTEKKKMLQQAVMTRILIRKSIGYVNCTLQCWQSCDSFRALPTSLFFHHNVNT